MSAKPQLVAASFFLAPVLSRESIAETRGQSVIDRLGSNIGTSLDQDSTPRNAVIRKALTLLLDIHYCLTKTSSGQHSDDILHDSTNRKVINGLLDLISIEGIYPFLSPGVGVPIERRVKSVLQNAVVKESPQSESRSENLDKELLTEIIDSLYEISEAKGSGLNSALQTRTLVDLISGAGELAFADPIQDEQRSKTYVRIFNNILDGTASSVLFPILLSLLQPTTPSWFQSHLSTTLSLLPTRAEGVRHTIGFMARTAPEDAYGLDSQAVNKVNSSSGPSIPLDVLARVSKLLTAVPSSITADTYFSAIAPQLLTLLDDKDTDMVRAAAYIIGNGILGRRNYGAPGTLGWNLFAQPILDIINPSTLALGLTERLEVDKNGNESLRVVVPEAQLSRALDHLSALTLLHPNPGLTKRLIGPLSLSLWGLHCYANETHNSAWSEKTYRILHTFLRVSADVQQVMRLSDQLLWDGKSGGTFSRGPDGGIEIRQRFKDLFVHPDIDAIMRKIDSRIAGFLDLLKSGTLDHDDFGTVFIYVSKQWLLGNSGNGTPDVLGVDDNNDHDPLQKLVFAKLTQKMLQENKDQLAASPERIIELVTHLFDAFPQEHDQYQRQHNKTLQPSLAGLGTIVETDQEQGISGATPKSSIGQESTEFVSLGLSLLSAMLSSPEFSLKPQTISLLKALQPTLLKIASLSYSLDSTITMTARNVSALIDLHISLANPTPTASKSPDRYASDRKTHHQALTYLADLLPPVRAHGISLLTALVSKASPVLDIPSTTILLLSLLQDEDDFIYLSAIKTLGILASRHSKMVVKMLVERYVDPEEEVGLDVRIRIGEALLKTVESLGAALAGEVAREVGEGMIAVAGRRSRKIKGMKERERRLQKEQGRRKEVNEAWGGKVPDIGDEEEDNEVSQGMAKVLDGWEGMNGEDDVRIRTSALSVLGIAIETHVAGMGSTTVSTAIDLAIAILKLEITSDKAILRRAAVMVIMSLVRGLDRAGEEGKTLGFGFAGENLAEVITVLQYVQATDADDVVVGHVKAVVESLEAWQSKSLLGMSASQRGELGPSLGLEGGRLAGLSVNPKASGGSRPLIEEIE